MKVEISWTYLTVLSNMKSLSPSPSFSSSSSITTFDATMCNSKSATAGCLAGILRRILCSGNLPTYPSDEIKDPDPVVSEKDQELTAKETMETSATPGIVARLMGLEVIPEKNLVHALSNTNSISRSRSLNSADHLAAFDAMQGQHRRVKSTLSFRELPTFLENDNFLVLSFENGGKSKELRSKGRKSELGFGESSQREAGRRKNVDYRTERVSEKKKKNNNNNNRADREANNMFSDNLHGQKTRSKRISDKPVEKIVYNGKAKGSTISPPPAKNFNENPRAAKEAVKTSKSINDKEVFNGGRLRRKKKISPCVEQKVESECSSEDSSPVSVLDFGHFLVDPGVAKSAQDSSSSSDSKSRRKLSPELENYKLQTPRNDSNLIGDEQKTKKTEGTCHGAKKIEYHIPNHKDLWDGLFRLTGAELTGSKWVHREMWKHEDYEGIDANFEQEILDQLVDELVGQLAGLP